MVIELSTGYTSLSQRDRKEWRERNKKELESPTEGAKSGIELVIMFYNIYSRVMDSETRCRVIPAGRWGGE